MDEDDGAGGDGGDGCFFVLFCSSEIELEKERGRMKERESIVSSFLLPKSPETRKKKQKGKKG